MLIQLHGIAAVNSRGQVLLMEIEKVPQVENWESLENTLRYYVAEKPITCGIYKIGITYGPAENYLDIDFRTPLCELRDGDIYSGENKL